MNTLQDSVAQVAAVEQFFDGLNEKMDRVPAYGGAANTIGQDMTECAV
jgi:hypothetical protein